MQLNLDKSAERTLIKGLVGSEGQFKILIGEQKYTSSLILSPAGVEIWEVTNLESLTESDYLQLSNLNTEVILLGTGNSIRFPDPTLTRPIVEKQMGLEVMDTAAACRTYNILLADARSVAAALIIEPS
ncbi:MAG: Mth938-like domain-containing protein [Acidiferrobacterales bacterium]|nr:Mth938-like domain-containing protein [Acidiferrobacterales bacterium]